MLTLESWCTLVMGGGVLGSRTKLNHLNKVHKVWYQCFIFVKYNAKECKGGMASIFSPGQY